MERLGIVLSILFAVCAGQKIFGYKKVEKMELWPERDSGHLKSFNYPGPSPANLENTFVVNGVPGSTIELSCPVLELPGQCDRYKMIIFDGKKQTPYCGNHVKFTYQSITATITVHFTTGIYGGGRFECTAKSTLKPGETIPNYLLTDSPEINSIEHGGKPGPFNTSCPCGWTNKKSHTRIVGGVETEVNEYPNIVSIISDVRNSNQNKRVVFNIFCGGSIITTQHVLTAAHCTQPAWKEGKKLSVIVGDHDWTTFNETDSNEIVDVQKIIVHENYDDVLVNNDISLLVLAKELTFTSKVGPACLAKGHINLDGQYLKGIGWGKTSDPGEVSKVLKKINIRVLPIRVCAAVYPEGMVNMKNKHQTCVFGKQRSLCMGDSGGPVMFLDPRTNRYTLAGVTSFGRSCSDFYPDVVTDVTSYTFWIQQKIKATVPVRACYGL